MGDDDGRARVTADAPLLAKRLPATVLRQLQANADNPEKYAVTIGAGDLQVLLACYRVVQAAKRLEPRELDG